MAHNTKSRIIFINEIDEIHEKSGLEMSKK